MLIVSQSGEDEEDAPAWETISAPTTGAVAGEAYGTAAVGECLHWSSPDASDLTKVDCADEHRFEVGAVVDLSSFPGSEFGPEAEYPTEIRFSELRTEICEPAVTRYMGARYDPRGRYSINLINPGQDGWQEGERTIRCGLQHVGVTGAVFPMVGQAGQQDQSVVWDDGFCIGINFEAPTDPVPCEEPHAYEVVGTVDLGEHFGDGYPPVAEQDRFLDDRCRQLAADYLGSPERLTEQRLTAFWDTRSLSSWLAGSRLVNCSIGAQTGAGGGFSAIVGSARGDITIDGQRPSEIALPEPPRVPGAPALIPGN
ncbi:hypothetical protein GCM10011410_16550 [Hoyosella rhizosphaerae]|uniref:Septum formation-related domain-containing protein n=2 Tax=Hoyosella rhizosphaerae TaxID=1755582 RepID=A0A916XDW6_9ACTN|nr:hypothetical protein GCM10011410_16550 [Hoyosella rhizosphaerae]